MTLCRFSILEQINNPIAMSTEDGEKIFRLLDPAIEENNQVTLCFEGIYVCTPTFLNAAIGKLYGTHHHLLIKELLSVVGMDDDELGILESVKENAIRFFRKS